MSTFRPHDTAVIGVPQKAPEGAITRAESAIAASKRVSRVSGNGLSQDTSKGQNTHNVSATITIKADEWPDVGDWMWENRESYNGLSVLPHADHTYKQAPFEDCSPEKYQVLYEALNDVDLTKIVEFDDSTNLSGELACSGGSCEKLYKTYLTLLIWFLLLI